MAAATDNSTDGLRLMEVGPRDGLQNEATRLSAETKIQFVLDLLAAGLNRIEAGAFVHPKWIPTMVESGDVFLALPKDNQARYTALVPNMVGFGRAADAGAHEVSIVLAVTDSHNQKNIYRLTCLFIYVGPTAA